MRSYLDEENKPPELKDAMKAKLASSVKNLMAPPQINPSSTAKQTKAMEYRRKELEEKAKREEDKKLEDKKRVETQNQLKGRVKESPAIQDNTQKMKKEREDKIKDAKKDFAKKDHEYKQMKKEMQERVNNRPLLLERSKYQYL